MNDELLFRIALTLVPHIGAVHARILLEKYGSAREIFNAEKTDLGRLEGIGEIRACSLKRFSSFKRAEAEIEFIEKFNIQPLFLSDEGYPKRFLNCYDPPTLLYYRGTANLNASKVVAIVGTRSNSDYGKHFTEHLVKALAGHDVLITSGLAFGIDAIAHKAALKYGLNTVGVVGHGLDTIYPAQHKGLAKDMTQQGGVLTEFRSETKPDKHNFPIRNRVVAGISDATIVVETSLKGGSMITAEMANNYNRDVFAVPGRTTDPKSEGCNYLVKSNKAMLLTDATQLVETLGWAEKKKTVKAQRELFINLTREEQTIIEILNQNETTGIDELNFKSTLSSSAVASAILTLELQGIITALPGKRYRLL